MHPYREFGGLISTTTRNDVGAAIVCAVIVALALGCAHFAVAAADAEHERAVYQHAFEAVSGGCR